MDKLSGLFLLSLNDIVTKQNVSLANDKRILFNNCDLLFPNCIPTVINCTVSSTRAGLDGKGKEEKGANKDRLSFL